uniref:Uncharacterized protein n=1 Tax=Malurus cyaneus samueli TaxID=2593467 RepID=A0A8C5T3Z3_9PASS
MAHPEVLGVHVQLVTVKLGQLGKGVLDAVQVLDGISEGGQHLLAMGLHLGVAEDGSGAGQVPEGGEEPLGPGGLDLPGQGLSAALGHVDLPQRPVMRAFSSAVHCTMVSAGGLRVAGSERSGLFPSWDTSRDGDSKAPWAAPAKA